MIPLLRDAIGGLIGVIRLMRMREGWRDTFDVSVGGAWRSFSAAFLAAPVFIYILAGHRRLALDLGQTAEPRSIAYYVIAYLAGWAIFPLLAALACALADRRDRFIPWLVVHNWTALGLFLFQGALFTLYLAGLLPPLALAIFLGQIYYLPLRLIVHWRVAAGVLDLPLHLSAACALIPMLGGMVMGEVLFALMAPAPAV